MGPLLFLIFINDITKCSNQFKYILYADDCTLSICVPGDNVMDSAELINSELKCLDRWLKSMQMKPSTCCSLMVKMQISLISVYIGNNTRNGTSVTKFLGIHLDKKLNFVNHITEMSMKVVKSI